MQNEMMPPNAEENAMAIEPAPEVDAVPVLQRLGPSPFPRSGFPLMGFLATLYDHVADQARDQLEQAGDAPN